MSVKVIRKTEEPSCRAAVPGALVLPARIRQKISGKAYQANGIGLSGASVLMMDDCVLKIAPYRKKNEETVEVMRWLEGKLPVPKVLAYECEGDRQYLLMSRVPGKMACDPFCMERPETLISGLAEALKLLWSVDVTGCPRIRSMDTELEEARYRVENHLVNMDNAEPSTFGPRGFKDPEDLLHWLEQNRPPYEPVLSHGDFCLPNVFFDGGRISGFIDLGDTGVGDKWRDIALCYRSLRWNAEGVYGGSVYPDIRSEKLFDALGIAPDPEKLRYYILLDELF